MDATPRARLNSTSSATTSQPAVAPRIPASATSPMPTMQAPCATLAQTQNHLRTGNRRTMPPIKICGSSASDSRIGTSSPIMKAGAPIAPSSQGSTTLVSASTSPVLLNAEDTV